MTESWTVEEMKAMRLDQALVVIADGIFDLAVERLTFESSCARFYGSSWSVQGTKNYRDLCAAAEFMRAFVKEMRTIVKAKREPPDWAVAVGEVARREWVLVDAGGTKHAGSAK